jgi:type II secretory pathway pseudopilin PulG
MQNRRTPTHDRLRSARAFTLPELVVAVGAAAILTASVGVLFRSVGDLSSTGVASVQLDAAARVMEKQLRDDFAALSNLSAEETFFAIRFREVGDIDRDAMLQTSDGEHPIYLTADDRQFDLELEIDPYTRDADGVQISRAITTRLDEMAFLAEGAFVSAQTWGGSGAVESPHARIYWGHGLKPLPDDEFVNDVDPLTGLPIRPVRRNLPDGDFGARAGDSFVFARGLSVEDSLNATGRNEYATGWSLARQASLLYGGNAASVAVPVTPLTQTIGDRWFAPYIRDQELFFRFGEWTMVPAYRDIADFSKPLEYDNPGVSEPRFMQTGRVDVINQDLTDVRRWLEGEIPGQYAGAYSSGAFADSLSSRYPLPAGSGLIVTQPLWDRSYGSTQPPPPNDIVADLQSAIAGVFSRPLLEDRSAQIIDRRYDASVTGDDYRERPEADLFDTHALMATRCSRFEIAWTDGSVAIEDIDVNGDGVFDYRAGDVIWFDISPILNDAGTIIRLNTLADWLASPDSGSVRFADPQLAVIGRDAYVKFPEILNSDRIALSSIAGATNALRTLNQNLYDYRFTGGSVLPDGDAGPEAYAIWGFREPNADGRYGRPWPKPTMIRVRTTLHDRELRTREGKSYEFIFPITPRAT